ncbi:ABC transporter ATP-binding protein [Saccharopolyspora sp. ASAGF58]|uniref:ABC transporter ATP-binding protein n=1 Tax=Saccharopolyspora sp. ASAGF58 TaxID=2719023 RepID=UPI0014477813|nr:ABC transporter ATP-binding protein [Saccharopolyspora sp. ASAGF58]
MTEDSGNPVALSLAGVTQRYGSVTAVDNVSLEVHDGEFFALVGPSGSGKTTLLMLIAGFERPQTGRVKINGVDVGAVPPQDRNIGVVFQNYALFPHMTVEQNVGFPLQMRRLSKAKRQERIGAALDLVRLSNKARMYPAQLSGGQQQRVALARALVFGPPILLLDEPLGALDRALREEMQIELTRIQQELRITVITVTHDQVEAMSLADRIAVMKDGALQQIDTPQQMYTSPSTHFIARFVGESSFVRGNVEPGKRHIAIAGTILSLREAVPADAGNEVELALRPEVIHMSTKGGDGIPAMVTGVIYFGPLWRITVELSDGQILVASVPGTAQPFAVGDSVNVSWSATDAVLLAPSEPTSTTSSELKE